MNTFSRFFLTAGYGVCRIRSRGEAAKLRSFERALRNAGIAPFNWVKVSSIVPPYAEHISKEEGLDYMRGREGSQLFYVCAEQASCEDGEQIGASVGVAVPMDRSKYGYLSEIHTAKTGETAVELGDRAEDLAAIMLAEVMAVDFDLEKAWDEHRGIFTVGDEKVKTYNITQMAIARMGHWTTVVSCAVLLP